MKSTGKRTAKQGEVYLAEVIFRDLQGGSKLRPVVVVSKDIVIDIDVIVASVTSTQSRNEYDIVLEHWDEAGLLKPSIARTSKLLTISQTALQRKLGDLHPADLERVLQKCRELF